MTSTSYLHMIMQQLATIIYNTSQSDSNYGCNSKHAILDSLKRIVRDYNLASSEDKRIVITDFRFK